MENFSRVTFAIEKKIVEKREEASEKLAKMIKSSSICLRLALLTQELLQ
jgi:hypothetical protein